MLLLLMESRKSEGIPVEEGKLHYQKAKEIMEALREGVNEFGKSLYIKNAERTDVSTSFSNTHQLSELTNMLSVLPAVEKIVEKGSSQVVW